jgi:predicted phosphodiesterase
VELARGTGTARAADIGYPAPAVTPEAGGSSARAIAGPYLQVADPSSMTVTWVTSGPATGWVEYGPPGGEVRRAVPVEDGLVRAGGRVQSVTLRGLMPGALYAYRAVTRPIVSYGPYKVEYGPVQRSETHEFTTSSPRTPAFSFVVMNDLHENVDLMRAHAARAAAAPFHLVFFNGDSLSHLEDDAQIVDRCLRPAGELFAARVPLVVVRGNHETRGKHARALRQYLGLPGGRYYYAFTHGSVRFIVLDTGEDKEDGHWAYSGLTDFEAYRAEQAEWLKNEVQSQAFRAATYRIVVAHMPFFGNDRTRVSGAGPTSCREHFGAILNGAGIDLHIAGHTHRADWVEPSETANRFPIVVGGGSAPGSNTLTRVDVSPEGLTITQTTDEGKVVLSRVVPVRR